MNADFITCIKLPDALIKLELLADNNLGYPVDGLQQQEFQASAKHSSAPCGI